MIFGDIISLICVELNVCNCVLYMYFWFGVYIYCINSLDWLCNYKGR